jgi:hypothetical protein
MSNYDILRLQNQVALANSQLAELRGKIKKRIEEVFPMASEFDDVLVFTESDAWLMVLEELRKLDG